MTKSWGPVWQCWRRNFMLSAILDQGKPVTRKHPRAKSYHCDCDKDLDKRVLTEERREQRALGVHHCCDRLRVTTGLEVKWRLNVEITPVIPFSKLAVDE
jgi:hypothetical protein